MASFVKKTQMSAAQVSTRRYRDFDQKGEIRIVLLGKTGNGKSASGNSILNRNAFKAQLSPCSITSECEKAKGTVDGFTVAVVDTPGIYDTKYTEEEVFRKLRECISLSAPGPHAFLIVINLGRFTEEEQRTVELLQLVFGEKAVDYSLVLFTHGDQLQSTTIEEFFGRSDQLSYLVANCNQRYHVLNNTVHNKHEVSQLLAKIVSMVCDNGGMFYTNDMFLAAERAIREQEKQIRMASAEQKRREEEQLRAKFEGEQLKVELDNLRKEYATKSREKAEKKNKFINPGLVLTTAEVGIAVGAAACVLGGPICIIVGGVVGGCVGALTGVFSSAAVGAMKKKCTVQ